MKRKNPPTVPIDPSPVPSSSTNHFNSAKGDDPKTSEFAFFKKLKTDAGRRVHSPLDQTPSNNFDSSHCPRERSSGIKNSSRDLRLAVEDVTHVNSVAFLSPVGTQTQHQDLFSTKRQKLHQWVTEISFPGIEKLCSEGYDFVSALLSRLFPESNEDNSFKIPRSAQVLTNAESKFLTSSFSNIHSRNPHQRNPVDVECDPYLDNFSSARWLGRSREKILSNIDSPTIHAHNSLFEYNLREPSCELGGERNAIMWIESDSAFSFPFKKYGYYSSSHLRELNDFLSLLQRKEQGLLLGWDSENVTDERTSAISLNTDLIKYSLSLNSSGDSHEGTLSDGFGKLGASRPCASPLICKHPSNFYSLPSPDLTSYCKVEFERHYIEDKEDIAADWDHYPLKLSHRPRFERHYVEDKDDIAAALNYRPLTSSRKPSFERHCIEEREDIATDLNPCTSTLSCKPSFGRQYIEDAEDIAANLNHCPLTLSCRPGYLSLAEDSDATIFDASMSFLSPGNHDCFVSKLPKEWRHDHEKEALLSSKLEFDTGRKCLSINEYEDCLGGLSHRGVQNHFSRDIVHLQDWSSFYFQMSLDKQKPCPLLADNSSCKVPERDTYRADGEAKYI